jgi:2'-5' RNA ligase
MDTTREADSVPRGSSLDEQYTRVDAKPQSMYGVVIGLPEEFHEEIASKRERLCPSAAKRIFPHITLRAPFAADDPKGLARVIEDVALRYLPVQVSAEGLGSFVGPRNNVLYAKVERSDRLMRLHEAVVHALPDVRDVFPDAPAHQFENWVPHITIADGITIERLQELRQELADYMPRCEWEARELLLVRSQSAEDGSILWTTTRSFRRPA